MNRKVTVVGGAGNVGATVARAIAVKELADVVIIDIAADKAKGIALDIFQACPIDGSDTRLVGTSDYEASAGSDVVVITSGVPRKPGMSRDDLLQVNYKIMQAVTEQVIKHSPNAVIVPVANPLDAMCQAVYRLSGFPRQRVVGMAGVLDSARMRTFIAMELGVSVENIHAFVLGGHGDTMVPLPRFSTVAGIPLTELVQMGYMTQAKLDEICTRTANGGAEITKLVGTSAWYAPGAAAAEMVEAILKDKKAILPCSVFLEGEYGVRDQFLGVPVVLGKGGAEKIIEIKLTAGRAGRPEQVGRGRAGTDPGDRGLEEKTSGFVRLRNPSFLTYRSASQHTTPYAMRADCKYRHREIDFGCVCSGGRNHKSGRHTPCTRVGHVVGLIWCRCSVSWVVF